MVVLTRGLPYPQRFEQYLPSASLRLVQNTFDFCKGLLYRIQVRTISRQIQSFPTGLFVESSSEPVSSSILTERLTEERLTSKVLATSVLVSPHPTALTIFRRRSGEYARIL